MEIVTMESGHISQVAALERVCFSDPWSEKSFRGELEKPLSLWLVAVEGDTLLGYIGSQTVLDEADIMNVAVLPARRKQGIGRALLLALERRLGQNGVKTLALEVRTSNDPAIRLYTALGYTQAGLRKKYYFHPVEDALILKKQVNL